MLGTKVWWPGAGVLPHNQYGAERFASILAGAYWPSAHNSLFRQAHKEATAMPVLEFRRLLDTLVDRGREEAQQKTLLSEG